jgi:hypothetical protein
MELLRVIVLASSLLYVCDLHAQLIADFETTAGTPGFALQEGTQVAVVSNPDPNGNSSSQVIQYQKVAGNWKAIYLTFSSQQNIGTRDALTFKLRSSTKGRVFVKLFNGPTLVKEAWAPSYGFQPEPNTWTVCSFSTADIHSTTFDQIQVNATVDNESVATVWLDDFRLTSPLAPNGEPIVDMDVSNLWPAVGEAVNFNASGSEDLDGTIVSYEWDFGNGVIASGAIVGGSYAEDGVYQVTLRVEDNEGNVSVGKVTVNVLPPGAKIGDAEVMTFMPKTFEKIEVRFPVKQYTHVYNPDEVSIDAVIEVAGVGSWRVPCFYFQPCEYDATADVWSCDETAGYWMARFSTRYAAEHKIKFELTDEDGKVSSGERLIGVLANPGKGIVRNDSNEPQFFRHSTGEPFYPLGINVAWNSVTNYATILNNLSAGGANLVRYWQAPFDGQALESGNGFRFYKGLGVYSQEAAAEQDSILALCESLGLYLQLVIFQHGMFSETVDSNWSFNPYNAANGGMLTSSEQYFYNESAKAYTKKLLRYIVARWGYSTHLFSWELFNEVQFTGNHPSQTAQWSTAVNAWHDEMGQYIKSLDAYDHIVSTSADDARLAPLLAKEGIDNVQYHLYSNALLTDLVQKDKSFRSTLTSVINGEYGTNVNADVSFDNQRHGIWTGIMTQVPHLMWRWENYSNTTWTNLFSVPASYLEEEDFVDSLSVDDWVFTATRGSSTYPAVGFKGAETYYGYVYDPSNQNNISDVSCTSSVMQPGTYDIRYYNVITGAITEAEITVDALERKWTLPTFSKAIAFKAHLTEAIVVGVETDLSGAIRLHPNPASDKVRIESPVMIRSLVLQDLRGSACMENTVNALVAELNVEALPAGLYIVQLETDRGRAVRKLVVH